MNLNCEIFAHSDTEHLQQIYTGFNLLHRQGFLNLKQTIPAEFLHDKSAANRWNNYKFLNTKIILNGKITVYYDMHDWNRIDEKLLSEADFYFKRSFDETYISQLEDVDKVFPLGLNYPVLSDQRDFFKLERANFYQGKEKFKTIIKSLKIAEKIGLRGGAEQVNYLEALPDFGIEPKILFMARVWDTIRLESPEQSEEVEQINQNRADCIRLLRREFGTKFFGGLSHDDFSRKHFKDCLLPDENFADKRRYLEMIKTFPICVATTGLNRSNGWKLGEYVALSKAIITEPLHFQVTGDFAAGKNYLEFNNSEELINAANKLLDDKHLRFRMILENYEYYKAFVRPDSMVLQSLAVVAAHSEL